MRITNIHSFARITECVSFISFFFFVCFSGFRAKYVYHLTCKTGGYIAKGNADVCRKKNDKITFCKLGRKEGAVK